MTIIVRTGASKELFQRKLVLTGIPGSIKGLRGYAFNGSFAGHSVRGQLITTKNGKVSGTLTAVVD